MGAITMKTIWFNAVLLFLVTILAACTSALEGPKWQPEKETQVFSIATRQLPPPPVYGAVRWVRPPEVTPAKTVAPSREPIIEPVVEFAVKNASLREAALVLAATARYASYCSSSIAEQKISLTTVGTIREIADSIEEKAKIDVVLDHRNKEVRFLSRGAIEPRF